MIIIPLFSCNTMYTMSVVSVYVKSDVAFIKEQKICFQTKWGERYFAMDLIITGTVALISH